MADDGIKVEGVRDLIRALKQSGETEIPKQMGRENKAIGQIIIDRLRPLPKTVGRGAGAKVRPSATARLVQLRAGGKHRDTDEDGRPHSNNREVYRESWGRIWTRRGRRRPHIVGAAREVMPEIEERYWRGVARAMSYLDPKKGR